MSNKEEQESVTSQPLNIELLTRITGNVVSVNPLIYTASVHMFYNPFIDKSKELSRISRYVAVYLTYLD